MGVRTVDIQQTLTDLTDVGGYELVKVFVMWGDRLIGSVTVPNQHRVLGARRLRDAIAETLGLRLLEYTREGALGSAWNAAEAAIFESFGAAEPPVLQETLSSSVVVSVVVATLDRPDGLRECIRGIQAQRSARRVEVIVVDNNPKSGVAASFSEADLKTKLDTAECTITFSIRARGKGHARFWTCDLTEDYIRINASYRT